MKQKIEEGMTFHFSIKQRPEKLATISVGAGVKNGAGTKRANCVLSTAAKYK